MKDKILEIINKSDRNLNATEILYQIKPKSTVEDLRAVLDILNELCKDGAIRTASGNTYHKNELITGILDVHEKGNAHLLMGANDDIFIPRDKMRGACDGDKVLVEVTNKLTNEGKVVKVIDRSIGNGLGEVYNDNGELKIKCLTKDLPYKVEFQSTDLDILDGHIVKLKYVRDLSRGVILASVDHIIAHKNAPDADTRLIAEEFNIPYEFSEEALEEAKKMPKELSEEMIDEGLKEGRTDYRDEVVFTIDGKDTKDIDDAISLKILPNGNYELIVHIADVSHYVKEGSALWKDAELRGNSNYLGDKVIPMLPIELSNGICSLNEGEDRFTISCAMEIDHAGNIVTKHISKGIINSRKKMNYDAVQDIIDDKSTEDTKDYNTLVYIAKEGDTIESIAFQNSITREELLKYNDGLVVEKGTKVNVPVSNILKNFHALSKILRAKKEKRGELEFIGDEKKYAYDDNGKVKDVSARVQREAEKMIEDAMIAANETVATTFFEKSVPFVYRLHGVPSPKSIEDFMKFLSLQGIVYNGKIDNENVSNFQLQDLLKFLKGKLDYEKYKVINKKLLRCMQKAYYGTENIGHFGIASPCYTHFTSPIRRFSDLLVHKSITEYLVNKNYEEKFLKDWASYLTYICEHISETERTSEKAEYAMDDLLVAEYMEGYLDEAGNRVGGHIGEEYDAIIDTCMPHAFFVQTNNLIEGRVDLSTMKEFYQYKEELAGYTRNNRVALRYGDKVRVKCIGASKARREVDFALVRKL